MRRLLALPLALASLLLPASLASAEPLLGGDANVTVQADQLDIDILAGQATLTGKVTLTEGRSVVSCPKIDLRFDHTPHLTWAKATGGVTADVRGVHAEAPSAELDLSKQVLDLHGGVKPVARPGLAHGRHGAHRDPDRPRVPHAGEGLASRCAKGP